MPVVINEMEVTPVAPKTSSAGAGSNGTSNGKPIDAQEIERAVAKQMERRIRVRAH